MPDGSEPGRVPEELKGFFEDKELRPAWSYQDVWGEEHKLAFTVAKTAEIDILADIHDAVIKAQTEGVPFKDFAKDLTPVLEQKGWFGKQDIKTQKAKARRLEVIYETNLRQARAHGQWDRIQRRKKSQPFLRYRLGPSQRHRPQHVALEGLVYPVDHPFWQTHMPINGYRCKCWVETLTRFRAEAAGGVSPELDPRLFPPDTYRDPRDGKKRTTPFGVDPGFEFPPGLAGRKAATDQALARRKK